MLRIRALQNALQYTKQLLKNASWLYLGKLVGGATGVISTLFVVSRFDVAEYGTVGYVIAFASTTANFIDFRVWETVINYYGEYREKGQFRVARAVLRYCFFLDTVTGLIAFAVIWLIADFGSRAFLGSSEITSLIRLFAFGVAILTAESTATAMMRVHDRYRWLGIYNSFSSIVRLLFVVGFLLWESTLESLLLAYVARNIVQAIIIYIATYMEIRYEARKNQIKSKSDASGLVDQTSLTRADYWEMFRFSIGTNIYSSLQRLAVGSDALFIGLLADPIVLGLYRLAFNLTKVIIEFRFAMMQVLYPDIVKALAANNSEKLSRTLRGASLLLGGVNGGLALGVLVIGLPILPFLLEDPNYVDAIPYAVVMLLGIALNSPFAWFSLLVMANRRIFMVNAIKLSEVVVWIIALVVCYYAFGGIGTAIALVLQEIYHSAATFMYIRQQGLLPGAKQATPAV